MLLILDLDNTLVCAHSTQQMKTRYEAYPALEFVAPQFQYKDYYIHTRPHLQAFLGFCFAHFDVAIWTAASKGYGEYVAEMILPDHQSYAFVYTREQCIERKSMFWDARYYIKPVHTLDGYESHEVILLDDSEDAASISRSHWLEIESWGATSGDEALLKSMEQLRCIHELGNVFNANLSRKCPLIGVRN